MLFVQEKTEAKQPSSLKLAWNFFWKTGKKSLNSHTIKIPSSTHSQLVKITTLSRKLSQLGTFSFVLKSNMLELLFELENSSAEQRHKKKIEPCNFAFICLFYIRFMCTFLFLHVCVIFGANDICYGFEVLKPTTGTTVWPKTLLYYKSNFFVIQLHHFLLEGAWEKLECDKRWQRQEERKTSMSRNAAQRSLRRLQTCPLLTIIITAK